MTNGKGRDHDRRVLNVHKWSRPWGFPLVTTTSWTKSVPSHQMNKYPSWVAARTVGEKTSCLGRRVDFDLRHDVFPPIRRSDNAAHGGY
jgi:hypothetical protein